MTNNEKNIETQQDNGGLPVVSGSVLIAEFLGSKYINDAPKDYPNGYYYQPVGIEYDCPTGLPEDWNFEKSWDWLIPVVSKILIGSYTLDGVKKMIDVQKSLITCSIEKTFESVCNFIEWYNSFYEINKLNEHIVSDSLPNFEYEMFFNSESDDFCKIDGWYPIATDRIKKPEMIEKYIQNGLLRKIRR